MSQAVFDPYAHYPDEGYEFRPAPPPKSAYISLPPPESFSSDPAQKSSYIAALPKSPYGSRRSPPLDEKDGSAPLLPDSTSSAYYPLSFIIFALWAVLIVAEICLLEKSVAVSASSLSQPWYYSHAGLPAVLLTIFAQGHGPVTAMHFSRLAVSGLRSPGMAPRTWLEMFWLADKNWAGPVGIVLTGWSALKLRVNVSLTLLSFSVISLVALVTPLVLGRAYPIQTIDVRLERSFNPSTLSPQILGSVNAYAQMAAGAGAWATNLTVVDLFNTTTFTPAGEERSTNSSDFFFAGDVQSMDTVLPGVRIQGGCQVVDGQTELGDPTAFASFCTDHLTTIGDMEFGTNLAPTSIELNISYCTNVTWFAPFVSPSFVTAFIWFDDQNGNGMLQGDTVQGLVRCDTQTSTGTATLYGRNLTFDHFIPNDTLYTEMQGGEPIVDPMCGAMYFLAGPDLIGTGDVDGGQLLDILGYLESGNFYVSPPLPDLASTMWRGASHMAAALALLSRSSDTAYPAVYYTPVVGYTRDTTFRLGAMFLLAVWLLGMVGLTAGMWRKASEDHLSSYTAARLVADRADLVRGSTSGQLEANPRLRERFEVDAYQLD